MNVRRRRKAAAHHHQLSEQQTGEEDHANAALLPTSKILLQLGGIACLLFAILYLFHYHNAPGTNPNGASKLQLNRTLWWMGPIFSAGGIPSL